MRRITLLVLSFSLLWLPNLLQAQAESAVPAPPQTSVTLGDSAVELGGLWKFHPGDEPGWRNSDLDDSSWPTLDLTPPEGSADASLGTSGFIPGWTSTGYPNHSGYAWYRLHVNVSGATRGLALKMPAFADDAYQVYVNGKLIGEFGAFGAHHVTAYSTQPQEYRLPKGVRDGPIVIAIRMWMDSATPLSSPDAGGMHGPPVLGYATVIATQTKLDWDEIDHEVGIGFLEALIIIMALTMALALFYLDREEKSYLWLAIVSSIILTGNIIVLLLNYTTWIGQTYGAILTDVVLTPLRFGIWILFWAYWFRLSRIGLVHRIVWPLVLALALGFAMLRPPLYGQFVPVHFAPVLVTTLLVIKLLLAAILFTVAFYGLKRERSEGWMVTIAMLLAAIANYQKELRLIHVKTATVLLDYVVSLGTVSTILSLLIITVLLLRRFIHSQRLKEQWKLEIHQAREVQQLLIPAKLPEVAGLSIESEYRPAREVGGDFFQIIPGAIPGDALIVVGDVTGKGMQAGMLVALIVGSIRSASHHYSDPGKILEQINNELCEREHASATCMILQVHADGTAHVANAGQIPPYLNNEELETIGALPLGTIPGMEYDLTTFQIKPGDALMLMSDGIAEAQKPDGELFGFDRVHDLLQQPVTAAEVATAAQDFGQEDDILVLRIVREELPVAV